MLGIDRMYQNRYTLNLKKVSAVFYKTDAGNEPVREFLLALTDEDKKSLGADIMAVEMLWPVGYPRVRKLEKDLWEIRSVISDKRLVRIFFTVCENRVILLHSIIKKSKKTPKYDIDVANKRKSQLFMEA